MISEKHQTVSTKETGWTFHGHEFLGGKMVKKYLNAYMPLNQK
jgi:tRNA nucleotidyltransferase (CCA-adding enzyme)